jgi:hypothetical protein
VDQRHNSCSGRTTGTFLDWHKGRGNSAMRDAGRRQHWWCYQLQVVHSWEEA